MNNPDEARDSADEELTERVREGDESAYGILADRYRPMTESAVRRFELSFAELGDSSVWGEDDLRQCAALALYRAAMTYDPGGEGRKVRFGLYAKICVNNALLTDLLLRPSARAICSTDIPATYRSYTSRSRGVSAAVMAPVRESKRSDEIS